MFKCMYDLFIESSILQGDKQFEMLLQMDKA